MAALGVPLVCSVHSIVGLDFAASLMPGWQESIFPPYFVVGAMYSGFAMVVVLALAIRWGLGLQAIITRKHFEVMGRILLMASIVMGYSYATEWFMAWYGGEHSDRSLVAFEFTGTYAPLFWALLSCNVVLPQALWFGRACGGRFAALFAIAIAINIGMWLERILIVWNTLSHGYMPSLWRSLPFHLLGLVVPDRTARAFRLSVPALRSPDPGGVDVRHARTRTPGGRGMNGTLLAEFRDPERLMLRLGACKVARNTPASMP